MHVHDGWDPLKEQEEVIEIQRVIGINDETLEVEEQDFDSDEVWTITPLETAGEYIFSQHKPVGDSTSDKYLTSDGSALSIHILGIFFFNFLTA